MIADNEPPLDWYLNEAYGPNAMTHLGNVHRYITSVSVLTAFEQIDKHSESGYNPQIVKGMGWELAADDYLIYKGLPPLAPAAHAYHLGDKVLVYPAGWVVICQLDGKFSVARVK